MTPELSALNPRDSNVLHTLDFSKVLDPSESIASVVDVVALPDSLDVGAAGVVDGKRPGCAVQFTLGNGTEGTYLVTATIMSTTGVRRARPVIVPVSSL